MPTSPINDQHLKQIQIRTIYLGLAIGRKQIRYSISLPGDEKYSWKYKKQAKYGFHRVWGCTILHVTGSQHKAWMWKMPTLDHQAFSVLRWATLILWSHPNIVGLKYDLHSEKATSALTHLLLLVPKSGNGHEGFFFFSHLFHHFIEKVTLHLKKNGLKNIVLIFAGCKIHIEFCFLFVMLSFWSWWSIITKASGMPERPNPAVNINSMES